MRRLVLRDLAAAFAFGSMAVSGELPLWSVGTFALGLVLGLAQRRVLRRGGTIWAVVLAGAAAVIYSSVVLGRIDLVVASCSFAGLITVHRMLAAPSPTVDGQIHLTSLLMLAGGAALSGELLFAVCLAGFAVCGTLALGLGVVDSRAAVRPLLIGALCAVLGSVAFFVLFPRLSWNVAARRAARGLGATTGFGGGVRLGGHGAIKTSARIVLRASLSPDPQVPELDAHWVGMALDTFDGRSWSSLARPRAPAPQVTVSRAGNQLQQRIELLPAYGSTTLVALDRPTFFANATARGTQGTTRSLLVEWPGQEVRFAQTATGYAYFAYSALPGSAARKKPAARDLAPLLQLPAGLDPRIARLAESVAGGEKDPRAAARLLEGYLKGQYGYTLDLGEEAPDPLAHFLFERKEGHCEYFATALTILLRARGIPAQLVGGFYGGERVGDEYVVRSGDAHVWTQAWIDDDFVTLDATPEGNRSAKVAAAMSWLTGLYEKVEGFWRTSVLGYSFSDQVQLASTLVRPPANSEGDRLPTPGWRWLQGLGAGGALILIWRARRLRVTRKTEATRLREGIDDALRRLELPDLPLEELGREVDLRAHPVAPPLRRATEHYLRARFGGGELTPPLRRSLVRDLRGVAKRTDLPR